MVSNVVESWAIQTHKRFYIKSQEIPEVHLGGCFSPSIQFTFIQWCCYLLYDLLSQNLSQMQKINDLNTKNPL